MNGEIVVCGKFNTTFVVTTGELLWCVWRMLFATMRIQLPLCSILFVTIFDRTDKSEKNKIKMEWQTKGLIIDNYILRIVWPTATAMSLKIS